ncbi:MAG: hypothetical protein NWE86_07805 [Candidatus Bathyarchaeota archaeon]|nr:hypothetical protein [Candidatus Bathyarchaeota archaeon]
MYKFNRIFYRCPLLDFSKRFSIGINIDDSWRYAGFSAPKSIIIPHLLSLDLPIGRVIDKIDELKVQKHAMSNIKLVHA